MIKQWYAAGISSENRLIVPLDSSGIASGMASGIPVEFWPIFH